MGGINRNNPDFLSNNYDFTVDIGKAREQGHINAEEEKALRAYDKQLGNGDGRIDVNEFDAFDGVNDGSFNHGQLRNQFASVAMLKAIEGTTRNPAIKGNTTLNEQARAAIARLPRAMIRKGELAGVRWGKAGEFGEMVAEMKVDGALRRYPLHILKGAPAAVKNAALQEGWSVKGETADRWVLTHPDQNSERILFKWAAWDADNKSWVAVYFESAPDAAAATEAYVPLLGPEAVRSSSRRRSKSYGWDSLGSRIQNLRKNR